MTEMHRITTSPSGLWALDYADPEGVLIFSAPTARLWRFKTDEEGTLAQFLEIAEAFEGTATAADLHWLANSLASAETWLETIPHDLARYGEIGVSY